MPYLIDSDIVLDHLAGRAEAIALLSALAADGVYISIVTYMESYQSVLRDPDWQKARDRFLKFIIGAPPLPFSEDVARECAQIRETLRLEGRRVRPRALDLMTAATASAYDLTLVTRNRRDYADIPGLRLYGAAV